MLVSMGAGAAAELLEEHGPAADGASRYFSNAVAEIFLDDDAALTHGCTVFLSALVSPFPCNASDALHMRELTGDA